MKVLALCLALVAAAVAENIYCNPATFATANFASEDSLRCKNGLPVSVEYSMACDTFPTIFIYPTESNFMTICETDYTLIGYSEYECDLTTGVYAGDLVDSDVLSMHSSCTNSTDNVCSNVDSENADKQFLSVSNAALQSANDTDIDSAVYYSISCASGYSFLSGVNSVYGYCSDSSTNAFTFHADSDSEGCFATCPANPDASLLTDSIDNLESLVLVESASGAVNSAEAVCSSGFDMADGAADSYDFTCEGALADDASEGKVSCVDCPVCIATCPANVGATFIVDAPDNLASLSNDQSKSGEIFSAEPVCDEGFAIGAEAASSYDYSCGSTVSDAADSGMVTCDDSSCPVCLAKCAAKSFADLSEGMASVVIDEGVADEEVVGSVVCDSDHALAWENTDDVYKFTCSPTADDGADEGQFVCGVDHACPVCEAKCPIVENDELSFIYIDGSSTGSSNYLPGTNHIQASCKNESLTLIGERYASCTNGSFNWDNEAPICADGDACEHPVVNNAYLPVTDNILAGEKYTVICNEGYSLDSIDAATYSSYTEATMACRGHELPEITCYAGCGRPDVLGGSVETAGNEGGGAAAYEDGDVVNFKCAGSIISGSEIATCEMGVLAAPVCGACNLATTSLLLISAIFYLLF